MKTKEEWLKFIVRFAQLDMLNLRKGDWLNLKDDVDELLWLTDHGQRLTVSIPGLPAGRRFSIEEIRQILNSGEDIDDPGPDLDELVELQRCCLEILQSIPQREFDTTTVEEPKIEVRLGFS